MTDDQDQAIEATEPEDVVPAVSEPVAMPDQIEGTTEDPAPAADADDGEA